MPRMTKKHRDEHALIESDQLRKHNHSCLLLIVHIAREHGYAWPLTEFEGNVGLSILLHWHDGMHGFPVFSDEALEAAGCLEGVRTLRALREEKVKS